MKFIYISAIYFIHIKMDRTPSDSCDIDMPTFCCDKHTEVDETMRLAYIAGAAVARETSLTRDEQQVWSTVSSTDIIVISVGGTVYDHINRVLDTLSVPYTEISATQQLLQFNFEPHQTIYINCSVEFPRAAIPKIKTFVESGGQLITTDWCLKNVLEVAFPGYVEDNGGRTGDEVVGVEVVSDTDPVVAGLFSVPGEADTVPQWWLEGSSYPIKVLSDKVEVLIKSDALKRSYGEGAVMVKFEFGAGKVYHMISHFYLQRTETRSKKQSTTAVDFGLERGVSEQVMSTLRSVSEGREATVNYGAVESAFLSAGFVMRSVTEQKKRYQQPPNDRATTV